MCGQEAVRPLAAEQGPQLAGGARRVDTGQADRDEARVPQPLVRVEARGGARPVAATVAVEHLPRAAQEVPSIEIAQLVCDRRRSAGTPNARFRQLAMTTPRAAPQTTSRGIVRADVDAAEQHSRGDAPRSELPASGEVRGDEPGDGGDEQGVTGDEALTPDADIASRLDVEPDRGARSLAGDERLHDAARARASRPSPRGPRRRAGNAGGSAATTATTGASTSVPSCCHGQITGYSAPGRSFTASERRLLG